MPEKTYRAVQDVLTYVVTFSFAVGGGFAYDYYRLGLENDVSSWGFQYAPKIILACLFVFAVSVLIKVWGSIARNRFWLRIRLSNFIRGFADKVDPRRK